MVGVHVANPRVGEELEQAPARALDPRLHRLAIEHYDFVWRSLRRLGVTPPETDDATQQVFLTLSLSSSRACERARSAATSLASSFVWPRMCGAAARAHASEKYRRATRRSRSRRGRRRRPPSVARKRGPCSTTSSRGCRRSGGWSSSCSSSKSSPRRRSPSCSTFQLERWPRVSGERAKISKRRSLDFTREGKESSVTTPDPEPLVRGSTNETARSLLASARDDAPDPNARDRMLAALAAAPAVPESGGGLRQLLRSAGYYVHGIGAAVILSGGTALVFATGIPGFASRRTSLRIPRRDARTASADSSVVRSATGTATATCSWGVTRSTVARPSSWKTRTTAGYAGTNALPDSTAGRCSAATRRSAFVVRLKQPAAISRIRKRPSPASTFPMIRTTAVGAITLARPSRTRRRFVGAVSAGSSARQTGPTATAAGQAGARSICSRT